MQASKTWQIWSTLVCCAPGCTANVSGIWNGGTSNLQSVGKVSTVGTVGMVGTAQLVLGSASPRGASAENVPTAPTDNVCKWLYMTEYDR